MASPHRPVGNRHPGTPTVPAPLLLKTFCRVSEQRHNTQIERFAT